MKHRAIALILLFLLVLSLSVTTLHAATLNVPGTFATIRAAVTAANSGDTIVVAPGTYSGTGNFNVTVTKNLTIRSSGGAAVTTIDIGGTVASTRRAFAVVGNSGPITVTIQGFTIKNGFTDAGGAITAVDANLTISQCVFTGNVATSSGGALYLLGHAATTSAIVQQSQFLGNLAGNFTDSSGLGGAIEVVTDASAAALSVAIVNSVFIANNASYEGGAVDINGGQAPGTPSVTINQCSFSQNGAFGFVTPGSFPAPDATHHPGTIDSYVGDVKILNSILYGDNTASEYSTLSNPALYGGSLSIQFSDVKGGTQGTGATTNGNIDIDPSYVNPASNLNLHFQSQAINAGTSSGASPIDLPGTVRDGFPDMGAYEYALTATSTALTALSGQPFSGQVATFQDSSGDLAGVAGFGAVINWGDGSQTAATISLPGGPGTPYAVSGSHSYAVAGTYTVNTQIVGMASGAGVNTSVNSQATVNPFPTRFAFSAPVHLTAGGPFTIVVTALGADNKTVPSYTGTIHFASTDTGAGIAIPADYTFTVADGGQHIVENGGTLVTAGNQVITVTDTLFSSVNGQGNLIVSAAAASQFALTTPGTAAAGAAFNVIVTAVDPYRNLATGYRGAIHFSSSDNNSVLPANYSFVAADGGAHTFTNGATLKTAGLQTITATDSVTSSVTGTSANIAAPAGAATHLLITAPSAAGGAIPFNFTVTAKDAFENSATGYNGTVHFTSNDDAAILPANVSVTGGIATLSATLSHAGGYVITATDTVNASLSGTSNTIATTNPQPVISSLSITSAVVNSSTFQLKIFGSRFISGAGVTFNGAGLIPVSTTSSVITVNVPSSLLPVQANVPIVVSNPAPAVADSSSVPFAIVPSCSYVLSSTMDAKPASAATGSLVVTAPAGCTWNATTNSAFLMVTAGSPGNGTGEADYSVALNTGLARTGTLTVAAQTFTVTQPSGINEIDTAPATGSPAGVAHVPLTLSLTSGNIVTLLDVTVTVIPSGGSPAPALTSVLTYQAAPGQPSAPAQASGNGITLDLSGAAVSFTGTTYLGDVLVSIPSNAQQNQTYAVALHDVGAISNGSVLNVLAGANNTLTVTSQYLVGDVWPFSANNAGFFADTPPSVNTLDLLEALRLTTNTEIIPSCSDRFDSADSWPLDTPAQRGGDGQLNTLDLLETLRRATNTDSSRPVRSSRGLTCPSTAPQKVVKPRLHPSAAEAVLEFGEATPDAYGNWQTPIYVRANVDASWVGLALAVESPLDDQAPPLKFVAGDGLEASLTDTSVRGKLAVAWLQDWEAKAGARVLLGYVETLSRPGSMSFVAASANAKSDGRNIKLAMQDLSSRKMK